MYIDKIIKIFLFEFIKTQIFNKVNAILPKGLLKIHIKPIHTHDIFCSKTKTIYKKVGNQTKIMYLYENISTKTNVFFTYFFVLIFIHSFVFRIFFLKNIHKPPFRFFPLNKLFSSFNRKTLRIISFFGYFVRVFLFYTHRCVPFFI